MSTDLDLTLGQRVRITDHLVRVELTAQQVLALGEIWPEAPEGALGAARALLEPSDAQRRYRLGRSFRIWAPASLFPRHRANPRLGWARVGTKQHPVTDLDAESFPLEGIVIQCTSAQDGLPGYDDGYHSFDGTDSRMAYRVAYHLRRRPLLALPTMISEVSS